MRQRARYMLICGIIVIGAFGVIAASLTYMELSGRAACAAHLKHIVRVVHIELVRTSDTNATGVGRETLLRGVLERMAADAVCPTSKEPYHFWLLRAEAGDAHDVLVAFEEPGNHRREGANVLFDDGHVGFLSIEELSECKANWRMRGATTLR